MCAVRDLAFAVVRQGDLPDDEQAQAVPLLAIVAIAHHIVGRVLKGFDLRVGHADAVVLHNHAVKFPFLPHRDPDVAALFVVRHAILEQIGHRPPHKSCVRLYGAGMLAIRRGKFQGIFSFDIQV